MKTNKKRNLKKKNKINISNGCNVSFNSVKKQRSAVLRRNHDIATK